MRMFRVAGYGGALVLLVMSIGGVARAGILRVRAGASGANNGTSWTNAYTDLQMALTAAKSGDEIWVAAGTYKATSGSDRAIYFYMKEGVALFGGFAGSETAREQRDWATNATILSGDIGKQGDISDNTYRVVVGANEAILDGFTVTGGNPGAEDGGGMYNVVKSPTVANCTFCGNVANDGAGMFNCDNSVTITNCTFSGNAATRLGGGVFIWQSSATLSGCTFTGNSAKSGGAMENLTCSPAILNCTFSGNAATGSTGGAIHNTKASPTVAGCVFNGNSAADDGGGMYNARGSPTITGSTFNGNSSASDGGGIYNYYTGSPTVSDCTFSNNTAWGGNGGGIYNQGDWLAIAGCAFAGNSAFKDGGGIYDSFSFTTLTNCVFCNNAAARGGAMFLYARASRAMMTNCTFTGNSASGSGGGIYDYGNEPLMTNCILWGDGAATEAEIYSYRSSSSIDFYHCLIQGSGGSGALWDTTLGTDNGGNIDKDPLFINAANPAGLDGIWRTTDDGLRPSWSSPCIDAGLANGAPEDDILGRARVGLPDIGAFEGGLRNATRAWAFYP